MKNGNITPGIWIRDDDEIGVEVQIGADRTLSPICTLQEPSLYHTNEAIAQKEANANLILAAPDMLAALKTIVDAWLSPLEKRALKVEMCEAARTAIAKAERGA